MNRLRFGIAICSAALLFAACSESPLNDKASYQYYASPYGEQDPVFLLITKDGQLELNTIDDTLRSAMTSSEREQFVKLIQEVPTWDTTYNSAKSRIEQKLSRSNESGLAQLRITRGSEAPAPAQELVDLLDNIAQRMKDKP